MGLKQAVKDFSNGIKVLKGTSEGEGDRKLARMALLILETVNGANKHEVRRRLVNSIESDFKREVKKHGEAGVDRMIDNALDTPEYRRLLSRLDMNESHLRIIKKDILKEYEARTVR